MSRRVSTAAAIGIALPSLLAGTLVGILLRSHAADAVAAPPRPVPRPPAAKPAPVRIANPAPLEAPASPAPKAPTPSARARNFQAAWGGLQEWFRGFDLKTRAGRERVPPDQLQRRAAELQQALLNDPEGYLAVLRSAENEDLFKFQLSLLCYVVGLEGGRVLWPPSQIPKPILDGFRELLSSGTSNQKLAILTLIQRESHYKESHLIGREDLVERCAALLSDPDPMLRVTAVQLLQSNAPNRADRRFEVLQELWQSSTDPAFRSTCLQALAAMGGPIARDFLFKSITQMTTESEWTKNAELQGSILQTLQGRASTLKPDEEERCVAVWTSAFRSISEPSWYQAWMAGALGLPLARATPLLEQAQSFAPTPELQASARRVLEQIRAGETRVDRLLTALRKAY